jgi:maltooligosyltrehalose trehalohydrolase
MVANFARNPVHVPRPQPEEVVLATAAPTQEPGFLVLPPLSGALVR